MLALVASACSPIVQRHGYLPSDGDLASIAVGRDDRASVQTLIGTPASASVLGQDGYFYVAQTVQRRGPRSAEVIDREIVAISFDDRGIVENIERFGLEDGNVVALSRRVTDSSVQDVNFLRQLLGNLGRFDPTSFLGDG